MPRLTPIMQFETPTEEPVHIREFWPKADVLNHIVVGYAYAKQLTAQDGSQPLLADFALSINVTMKESLKGEHFHPQDYIEMYDYLVHSRRAYDPVEQWSEACTAFADGTQGATKSERFQNSVEHHNIILKKLLLNRINIREGVESGMDSWHCINLWVDEKGQGVPTANHRSHKGDCRVDKRFQRSTFPTSRPQPACRVPTSSNYPAPGQTHEQTTRYTPRPAGTERPSMVNSSRCPSRQCGATRSKGLQPDRRGRSGGHSDTETETDSDTDSGSELDSRHRSGPPHSRNETSRPAHRASSHRRQFQEEIKPKNVSSSFHQPQTSRYSESALGEAKRGPPSGSRNPSSYRAKDERQEYRSDPRNPPPSSKGYATESKTSSRSTDRTYRGEVRRDDSPEIIERKPQKKQTHTTWGFRPR